MLWFRDTDFLMANRHGRAPTALVQDGRMFVEGLNGLRAQSIYNGTVLWEFDQPGILAAYNREHSIGAAWTGGNMCLGPQRVYLHDGELASCWTPRRERDGSMEAAASARRQPRQMGIYRLSQRPALWFTRERRLRDQMLVRSLGHGETSSRSRSCFLPWMQTRVDWYGHINRKTPFAITQLRSVADVCI